MAMLGGIMGYIVGVEEMRLRGGAPDQEMELHLSPRAGALLWGAPCGLSPTANFDFYTGLRCR